MKINCPGCGLWLSLLFFFMNEGEENEDEIQVEEELVEEVDVGEEDESAPLLHGDTPFCPPAEATTTLGYINTREQFREYYDSMQHDVLCPLIIFLDRTHVDDAHANHCLEPVSFTLDHLNRQTS